MVIAYSNIDYRYIIINLKGRERENFILFISFPSSYLLFLTYFRAKHENLKFVYFFFP